MVDIGWYRGVIGTKKDFAVFLGEMPHPDGFVEQLDQSRAAAASDRGRRLWFDEDGVAAVES